MRDGDADTLHALRVSSRRLRAALSLFAPCFGAEENEALAAQAAAITKGLGRARELDVLIMKLDEWHRDYHPPWSFAAEHAAAALRKERTLCQPTCEEAVARAAAPAFETAYTALLNSDPATTPPLAELAPAWLTAAYEDIRTRYASWRDSREDEELHHLRIALKDFRYGCEFLAPRYGKKLARFAKSLKALQGDLGEWHDRLVLRDLLATLEPNAPYRAMQGYPELVRDADEEAAAAAKSFRKAAKKIFGKGTRKKAHKTFAYEGCTEDLQGTQTTTIAKGSNGKP